jgi:hypothetical protein
MAKKPAVMPPPIFDLYLRQQKCRSPEEGRWDFRAEIEIVKNTAAGSEPFFGPLPLPYSGVSEDGVRAVRKILQDGANAILAEGISVAFFDKVTAWLTGNFKITGISYDEVLRVQLLMLVVLGDLTDMGIEHGKAKGYDVRKAEALRKKLRGK